MSRIGKHPVTIPAGVQVTLSGRTLTVKGPLGQIARDLHPAVAVEVAKDGVTVKPPTRPKETTALQGLTRTLVSNMVEGVTKGFKKELDMEGVGYRATVKGNAVEITVGLSHPVNFPFPQGITIEVDKNNRITVKGVDREKVGQTAADIRSFRPPEPYKGKGIRYAGEHIRRKVGKAGAK